ncbi:MAG: DEAD/DEAH box helicase, partial [Acidobacteria bacterium]|nr:DEAD/DEAH box helicase [Acidobacteriota bacterium]
FVVFRRTSSQELFDEMHILARGNDAAVPALVSRVHWGDLTVHNHPSGVLKPSQADLNVASVMGELGVGSMIVDNSVSHGYMVVEPSTEPQVQAVESDSVLDLFASDGALAKNLDTFELRPGQRDMAEAVLKSLNEGTHLVVEAGTGTGKSLAYLIPALLWTRANRKRIVIATKTIALQEQLLFKDIPLARKLIENAPHAALIKGRSNYVCLRKLEDVTTVQMHLWDDQETQALQEVQDIAQWVQETGGGDKAQLPFLPSYPAWEKVQSESDMCLGSRCPHFQRSPFFVSRRESARSGILVVNQALLFSDLAVRLSSGNYNAAAVMPPYDAIILDEAHSMEDIATAHFGSSLASVGLRIMIGRLMTTKGTGGLLLRIAQFCLKKNRLDLVEHLETERFPLFRETRDQILAILEQMAFELHEALNPAQEKETVLWLHEALLEGQALQQARITAKNLFAESVKLMNCLKGIRTRLGQWPEDKEPPELEGMRIELDARYQRLDQAFSALKNFALKTDGNQIPWLALKIWKGQKFEFEYNVSPLDVSEALKKALFEPFRSVIMTSATLNLGDDFAFFRGRVGLDTVERSMELKTVESPFNYPKQAALSIPKSHLLEWREKGFTQSLADLICKVHPQLPGGSLVLFTSYGMLNAVARLLEPELARQGTPLLIQGSHQRRILIERLKETHGVLLGTDSFWEGVDLAGPALCKLFIAKLPFPQMKEPIFEARSHALDAQKKSSFRHLSLPLAQLKFKQGVGRLIRSKSDRGIIVVTDTRILDKAYGRDFLKVIPNIPVVDFEALWHNL